MDQAFTPSTENPDPIPVFTTTRAHRLIHRLLNFYGAALLVLVLYAALAYVPQEYLPLALTREKAQAAEALAGGFAGLTAASLLLILGALSGAYVITRARFTPANRNLPAWELFRRGPGYAARVGQGVVVPLFAVAAIGISWYYWPRSDAALPLESNANIVGAFAIIVAFVALITERTMHDFPAPQMPEAPGLRRVLLLVTILLFVAGVLEILRGAGFGWVRWGLLVVSVVPGLVAGELGLRALARLFVPAPKAEDATSVCDSILAALITGGPRAPSQLLKSHLGLDFARSWALSFLSAAALPAMVGTGLLCWGLSGLKLIDIGGRGVYERFGAPVAVYGPGLHLLLPWPMGTLRNVEYGTVHEVAIGVDEATNPSDNISAEAVPPPSMDRLWETAHEDEAHYLVANFSRGQQEFQAVSTEIHVLYRVGLTNQDALNSIYGASDPETLVRETAGRLVLNYFDSHTLDQVLVGDQARLQNALRSDIQRDINAYHAGIEVVGVVVAEIHPPAGAASAYRLVQAAEINARTQISNEKGRAERMRGVAQQEARVQADDAAAQAAETLSAANQTAYRFNADRKSYALGPDAFLLERRDTDLLAALSASPLTLIDARISPAQTALIDLRSGGTDITAAVAPAPTASITPAAAPDADASAPNAEAAAQITSTIASPDKTPAVSTNENDE
jgi:regulator of protease activity HflC (stomatin/prohibitin superfamily)